MTEKMKSPTSSSSISKANLGRQGSLPSRAVMAKSRSLEPVGVKLMLTSEIFAEEQQKMWLFSGADMIVFSSKISRMEL